MTLAPAARTHCLVPRATQTWPFMQPPCTTVPGMAHCFAVVSAGGVTGAVEPLTLQLSVPVVALMRKLLSNSMLRQVPLVSV